MMLMKRRRKKMRRKKLKQKPAKRKRKRILKKAWCFLTVAIGI